jgi:hypothetical protein
MGARESIPIHILLHSSNNHDVPKDSKDQARNREAIEVRGSKRCELKLPMEIKRTSRIRCGGCVPTGAIASCYHINRRGSLLPFIGLSASEE